MTSRDTLEVTVNAAGITTDAGFVLEEDSVFTIYTATLADYDGDLDVDEDDAGELLSHWKSDESYGGKRK